MTNEQNLRPVQNHEEAVKRGRNGGKSKSPLKRWTRIKVCDKRCPFFDSCPAISTSHALPNHNCFIKSNPKEIQNYFIKLFAYGEQGLISIIMNLHFRLILKTQNAKITTKELKEVIACSLDIKKGIYGDKQKIEHSGEMKIIQVPELRKILRENEENERRNTDIVEA